MTNGSLGFGWLVSQKKPSGRLSNTDRELSSNVPRPDRAGVLVTDITLVWISLRPVAFATYQADHIHSSPDTYCGLPNIWHSPPVFAVWGRQQNEELQQTHGMLLCSSGATWCATSWADICSFWGCRMFFFFTNGVVSGYCGAWNQAHSSCSVALWWSVMRHNLFKYGTSAYITRPCYARTPQRAFQQ